MSSTLLKLGLILLANTQTSTQAHQNWDEPLTISTKLESFAGSGSFISNKYTDAPYYSSSLYLTPEWALSELLSLSASLVLSYEWTALVTPCLDASNPRPSSGPTANCSDTDDPSGRRFQLSDLRIGLYHAELYELFGAVLSGGGGVSLPTSIESRFTNNILTLDLGTQVSRSFGPLSVDFGVSGSKFFPTDPISSLDAVELASSDIPIGHCPSYNQNNCLLLSGFLPSWRFSSDFSLTLEIPAVENLSASIGISYAYSRRFSQDPDQFSSNVTDQEGNAVVDGNSSSDTTGGYLEVSYAIDKALSVSAGVSSGQPARTEDGQNLRFPFYDFISPANNYSGFYLSFSHSI